MIPIWAFTEEEAPAPADLASKLRAALEAQNRF